MTVYNSGPVNIEQGNSAEFTIEFLDSTGSLTVPSCATMSVVYTNTSNTTTTDAVTLSADNSFFTGTWSSVSAALGLATYTVLASGSTVTQSVGQIRIIQRQSTY